MRVRVCKMHFPRCEWCAMLSRRQISAEKSTNRLLILWPWQTTISLTSSIYIRSPNNPFSFSPLIADKIYLKRGERKHS